VGVSGDARVCGDARVSGNAQVSGNARVCGDARVSGNAWVYGNARVCGDAQVSGGLWEESPPQIQCGRWTATLSEPGVARIGCEPVDLDRDIDAQIEFLADKHSATPYETAMAHAAIAIIADVDAMRREEMKRAIGYCRVSNPGAGDDTVLWTV
jgi:hypothetical protein